MTENMNDIASKTLGDSTSYAVFTDKFDSSLLNPMPRNLAREGWGIRGDEFEGVDVWHCHESTFLLDSGKPVSGTLKFVYSAGSEFMVESKSMKLYLNSFDMCRMGATTEAATKNYVDQVSDDLTKILGTTVRASFFQPYGRSVQALPGLTGWEQSAYLDQAIVDSAVFDDFESTRNHVKSTDRVMDENKSQRWFTNSLRSRCRHTKQKDTGAAYFIIQHNREVDPGSLLRQVVSLREVNEFHEFCAEKLFVEIAKELEHAEITVALLYARRGSLDINPVRWSPNAHRHDTRQSVVDLCNPSILTTKAFGQ